MTENEAIEELNMIVTNLEKRFRVIHHGGNLLKMLMQWQ